MPDTFGARLRRRREQEQISLSTIAEQTKIKLSLLEALERDDVSHWPSGIFRRAFIRAYAHAIGLEPDIIVREFLDLYPDPAEIVEPMPAIAATIDGSSGGAPTRLRYLVASAVGSLSRRRSRSQEPAPGAASARSLGPRRAEPASFQAEMQEREPLAVGHADPALEVTPPEVTSEHIEVSAPEPAPQAAEPPAAEPPLREPSPEPIDLPAIAELCTQLGRVASTVELQPLLQETARILDAAGLVVWMWDHIAAELHPALAYGYSERVLAQLPGLPRGANNATAAAFRATQTCVVPGDEGTNGALVLPLLTPSGCVGVLALELQKRGEEREAVRAAGTIIAAQLAALMGVATPAETAEPARSAR